MSLVFYIFYKLCIRNIEEQLKNKANIYIQEDCGKCMGSC